MSLIRVVSDSIWTNGMKRELFLRPANKKIHGRLPPDTKTGDYNCTTPKNWKGDKNRCDDSAVCVQIPNCDELFDYSDGADHGYKASTCACKKCAQGYSLQRADDAPYNRKYGYWCNEEPKYGHCEKSSWENLGFPSPEKYVPFKDTTNATYPSATG